MWIHNDGLVQSLAKVVPDIALLTLELLGGFDALLDLGVVLGVGGPDVVGAVLLAGVDLLTNVTGENVLAIGALKIIFEVVASQSYRTATSVNIR